MLTTSDRPLLENGPPPLLLSVIFIVKPYVPAGVEPDVLIVKVIVELLPLGLKVGVVVVPLVTFSVAEVKLHVTPVGALPLAQVNRILSELGVVDPLSFKLIV